MPSRKPQQTEYWTKKRGFKREIVRPRSFVAGFLYQLKPVSTKEMIIGFDQVEEGQPAIERIPANVKALAVIGSDSLKYARLPLCVDAKELIPYLIEGSQVYVSGSVEDFQNGRITQASTELALSFGDEAWVPESDLFNRLRAEKKNADSKQASKRSARRLSNAIAAATAKINTKLIAIKLTTKLEIFIQESNK